MIKKNSVSFCNRWLVEYILKLKYLITIDKCLSYYYGFGTDVSVKASTTLRRVFDFLSLRICIYVYNCFFRSIWYWSGCTFSWVSLSSLGKHVNSLRTQLLYRWQCHRDLYVTNSGFLLTSIGITVWWF